MRVSINPEACTGHGRCYTLAPEVFDCDDSGFGVVLSEEIGDDKIAAARLGEQSCPESAITISE